MSEYVELIFEKYSDDVYMVQCGFNKHMLTIKNCDVLNTLMLFSVLAFNKFVVRYAVDSAFWKAFIKFIKDNKGIIRDIKFENILEIGVTANKLTDARLFYSGGKDSTYSHILELNIKLIQYRVQVYKAPEIIGVETMSTNFDNELFHKNRKFMKTLKLEMYLPIISNYKKTYMGIEKEIWQDSVPMIGYNLIKWASLLHSFGIVLYSPVKNYYSFEILQILKDLNISFEKCQATDKGNKNEFCYACEKCLTYYIQGCNVLYHSFDREIWERQNNYVDENSIYEHITKQCEGNEIKYKYFINMLEEFKQERY